MIQESTLQFLTDLQTNNNREWFNENKRSFQAAKQDFEALLGELIQSISKFDPGLIGLQPKDCVFRIYRDVRFSKNKEPYKTNFGASLTEGGRKSTKPGYYIHLKPGGESFVAGGLYMPQGDRLKAVRQEIDYNQQEFEGILNDKTFKKYYKNLWDEDKLKTAPKGYSTDNPAIEWLRYKSYIVSHQFSDKDMMSKGFVNKAVKAYEALKTLNDFLNKAMD